MSARWLRQLVSTLQPAAFACQHASAFQASLSAKSICGLILTHTKNRSRGNPSPEPADAARDDLLTSGGPKDRNVLTC
jgi:hypothetical protein